MSIIDKAMKGEQRYANHIREHHDLQKGHIVLNECVLCGWLSWKCTRLNEPDGYSVDTMSVRECPRCDAVSSRSPEVFDWISGVISNVCRDVQKRVSVNGEASQ